MMRNKGMTDSRNVNWIIWGSVIAAAAAGVIYYLNNKEDVDNRLGDLRDKASDALDRAKTRVRQQMNEARSQM